MPTIPLAYPTTSVFIGPASRLTTGLDGTSSNGGGSGCAVSDGSSRFPEIKNVDIKVNDKPTPFDRIQGPEPTYGFENQDVPWASFGVSFIPGDDVQIKVSYDLDGTSYPQETYTSFYYILSTGAGWNGTIGSGEIVLRLPYDANPQNVILGDSQNTPQFTGREAH